MGLVMSGEWRVGMRDWMVRGERAKRKGERWDGVWFGLFLGGKDVVVGLVRYLGAGVVSGCCWHLLAEREEFAAFGQSPRIGHSGAMM